MTDEAEPLLKKEQSGEDVLPWTDEELSNGLTLNDMLAQLAGPTSDTSDTIDVKMEENEEDERFLGVVETFWPSRGFGVIRPQDSGPTLLAHWSQILSNDKWPQLDPGMPVMFSKALDKGKLTAKNITGLDGRAITATAQALKEFRELSGFAVTGIVEYFSKAGNGHIELEEAVPEGAWHDELPVGSKIFVSREELVIAEGSVHYLKAGMRVQFKLFKSDDGTTSAAEVTDTDGEPLFVGENFETHLDAPWTTSSNVDEPGHGMLRPKVVVTDQYGWPLQHSASSGAEEQDDSVMANTTDEGPGVQRQLLRPKVIVAQEQLMRPKVSQKKKQGALPSRLKMISPKVPAEKPGVLKPFLKSTTQASVPRWAAATGRVRKYFGESAEEQNEFQSWTGAADATDHGNQGWSTDALSQQIMAELVQMHGQPSQNPAASCGSEGILDSFQQFAQQLIMMQQSQQAQQGGFGDPAASGSEGILDSFQQFAQQLIMMQQSQQAQQGGFGDPAASGGNEGILDGFQQFVQQLMMMQQSQQAQQGGLGDQAASGGSEGILDRFQQFVQQQIMTQQSKKPNQGTKRVPCKFFGEGRCTRENCPFSHDVALIGTGQRLQSASSTPQCKFFQQGGCMKGNLCPFLHGDVSVDGERVVAVSAQPAGKPLCKFFLQGTCAKGFDCAFSHSGDLAMSVAMPMGSNDTAQMSSNDASQELEFLLR